MRVPQTKTAARPRSKRSPSPETLRDDGKGIAAEYLTAEGREGHFGLHGMRERAKLVGGKITVWTASDSGTEIELTTPRGTRMPKPHLGVRGSPTSCWVSAPTADDRGLVYSVLERNHERWSESSSCRILSRM